MDRPHDDLAQIGLVDEELGLDGLSNPQLDRVLPRSGSS
jgi:hypothetical protein